MGPCGRGAAVAARRLRLCRRPGVSTIGQMPETSSANLTNHFLVAMPGLADSNFGGSVVFVAELPRNPGGKVVKPTLREMV